MSLKDDFKTFVAKTKSGVAYGINILGDPAEQLLKKFSPLKGTIDGNFNVGGNINVGIPSDFDFNVKLPQMEPINMGNQRKENNINVFQMLATDLNDLLDSVQTLEYMNDILQYGHYQNVEEEVLFLEVELIPKIAFNDTIDVFFEEGKPYTDICIIPATFSIIVNKTLIEADLKNRNRVLAVPRSSDGSIIYEASGYMASDITIAERHLISFKKHKQNSLIRIVLTSKNQGPDAFMKNYKKITVSIKRLYKNRCETLHVYENKITESNLNSIEVSFDLDRSNFRDKLLKDLNQDKEAGNLNDIYVKIDGILSYINKNIEKKIDLTPDPLTTSKETMINYITSRAIIRDNLIKEIWSAKNLIEKLKISPYALNYRFRFKVELVNRTNKLQIVDKLELLRNANINGQPTKEIPVDLIGSQLNLAPYSTYQTTIYPTICNDLVTNKVVGYMKRNLYTEADNGVELNLLYGFEKNYTKCRSTIIYGAIGGQMSQPGVLEFNLMD